jgi:hypothetical protein
LKDAVIRFLGNKMRKPFLAMLVALGVQTTNCFAVPIQGSGTPLGDALLNDGGAEITFDADPKGDFGNVTIDGVGIVADPVFTISDKNVGKNNTDGTGYLSNSGDPSVRRFRFELPDNIQAFGFNFGGSEADWVLRSYDDAGDLIEQLLIDPDMAAVDHAYFGLAADIDVQYATLTALQLPSSDVVYIDNFSFKGSVIDPSPVPLQGSAGFIGLGVMILAAVGLRKRQARMRGTA